MESQRREGNSTLITARFVHVASTETSLCIESQHEEANALARRG